MCVYYRTLVYVLFLAINALSSSCLMWCITSTWLKLTLLFCLFTSLSSTHTYMFVYLFSSSFNFVVCIEGWLALNPCVSIIDFCVFVCVFRCAPGFLGEYCQHMDPCQPGYCLNGGNCSVSMLAGVPVPGSATCTCPLGFTGQHCKTPQNSTCYPNNPCANQGVCTLLSLDKYKCECARGWTGEALILSQEFATRTVMCDFCVSPQHWCIFVLQFILL